MKPGDLVSRKDAFGKPDWGVGVVVSYDGYGRFKVLWSSRCEPTSHDLYELVSCESR